MDSQLIIVLAYIIPLTLTFVNLFYKNKCSCSFNKIVSEYKIHEMLRVLACTGLAVPLAFTNNYKRIQMACLPVHLYYICFLWFYLYKEEKFTKCEMIFVSIILLTSLSFSISSIFLASEVEEFLY